tara:strand:- start:56 stop:565 length:510 start_codon:yes stop_codon:yes gene_type:complete
MDTRCTDLECCPEAHHTSGHRAGWHDGNPDWCENEDDYNPALVWPVWTCNNCNAQTPRRIRRSKGQMAHDLLKARYAAGLLTKTERALHARRWYHVSVDDGVTAGPFATKGAALLHGGHVTSRRSGRGFYTPFLDGEDRAARYDIAKGADIVFSGFSDDDGNPYTLEMA